MWRDGSRLRKHRVDYWQAFEPGPAPAAPFTDLYPATMPDGTVLPLPLRDYGEVGVGGFIVNQASFTVLRHVSGWMTEAARPFGAEAVVGLPTLGHGVAPMVAEGLGHANWVAAGYSRKRWYEEALSAPVFSSTTPGERRVYLDPRIIHRLRGRRVLLVDDVISSGTSALAGLSLLATVGVVPVALCVGMIQGRRWAPNWPAEVPVVAGFETPLLHRMEGGWAAA